MKQIGRSDGSNTHDVIGHIFRAMNTKLAYRAAAHSHRRRPVPHVNGGLFPGGIDAPRFSSIARTILSTRGS